MTTFHRVVASASLTLYSDGKIVRIQLM